MSTYYYLIYYGIIVKKRELPYVKTQMFELDNV